MLATKIANPMGEGPNGRGASRVHVFRAVEGCLRRLQVETIDILYLHSEDHATPMEETVRALADLVRAGKLRYFGLSNYPSWRVAEMCRLSDVAGIDRPVVSQPLYNALNRMAEVEHLPACAHLGVGVFPYSPLARGVLTGKYAPGEPPAQGTRAGRQDKRMLETEWREESLRIAQELAARAAERKVTPGQFALAWVLNNRLVTGAIAGPRTLAQWEDYVGALDDQAGRRGRGAGGPAGAGRASVRRRAAGPGPSAGGAGSAQQVARPFPDFGYPQKPGVEYRHSGNDDGGDQQRRHVRPDRNHRLRGLDPPDGAGLVEADAEGRREQAKAHREHDND